METEKYDFMRCRRKLALHTLRAPTSMEEAAFVWRAGPRAQGRGQRPQPRPVGSQTDAGKSEKAQVATFQQKKSVGTLPKQSPLLYSLERNLRDQGTK